MRIYLILMILISLNALGQGINDCRNSNYSNINQRESEFLNTYLTEEREEFDFKNKKIIFVTGNSGNLMGCKEQYFDYINEWKKKGSKVATKINVLSESQKNISGGYDVILTYWVKQFTERREKQIIKKIGENQNKLEYEIFESIINHINTKDDLYINCTKPKTYFDYEGIRKQIDFNLQNDILQEIEKNATKSEDDFWKSEWIAILKKKFQSIKNRNCLTKKDIIKLFEKTGRGNSVITISNPIFNNNYESCIVAISYLMFPGSAYGHSYFLQKIEGVWTIKAIYNNWLS